MLQKLAFLMILTGVSNLYAAEKVILPEGATHVGENVWLRIFTDGSHYMITGGKLTHNADSKTGKDQKFKNLIPPQELRDEAGEPITDLARLEKGEVFGESRDLVFNFSEKGSVKLSKSSISPTGIRTAKIEIEETIQPIEEETAAVPVTPESQKK